MKKSLIAAAVAMSALFAGSSMAEGSLSYNIGATTNYIFRGVSQTDNAGAIQGGVDYSNGLYYVGAWASNVDFGSQANTEIDLYAGIKPTAGNYSFDFGVLVYTYPREDALNVTELKAAVSHPMGAGAIGTALYIDAETLEDPYMEIFASYPLTDKFSVSGALGNSTAFDYTTWNIGGTYALTSEVALDVRYSEVSKDDKTPISKPTLFATLKAAF